MIKLFTLFLTLSNLLLTTNSLVASQSVRVSQAHPQSFNYANYATVLSKYVNAQGQVNYVALQANRQLLDNFNTAIGNVPPTTYQNWSDKQKLAFLINAYNSFTLQSIIDRSPLPESIRDIPGVWRSRQFKIAGELKTLDQIEHETIRKNFNEPRIHIALVCAAISCPPLLNQPYVAEKLDQQLEERSRKFLTSPQGFKIDKQTNTVWLSSIFKWYGQDWEKSYSMANKFAGSNRERAVLNFISRYLSQADRLYLEKGQYKINYLDYNWSLNSL